MYNTVFFDLDGTLTESAPGITTSVAYSLKHWGIEVKDLTELNKFVGPPLYESYEKFYGFSKEEAVEAVKIFRSFYNTEGLFISSVYPGIPELLQKIKDSGRKIMLATSKPEVTAIRILEHFDLMKYFDVAAGATEDSSRVAKADVIRYLMGRLPKEEQDVSKIIMVGDREHDVFGAREVGIDCIGVLFGYGDRQELERAGTKYIAETAADVFEYL